MKKCALYILSLLAGKLEKICTAFPLATFWTKTFKGVHLELFPPKKAIYTILNTN